MKQLHARGALHALRPRPSSDSGTGARHAAIRTCAAVVSAVVDEHALALIAASKAALPQRDVAELRRMYVPPNVTICLDDA